MKSTADHFFCFMVDPKERIVQHLQLSNKHWFQEMKQLGDFKMLERHQVLNNPHCEWWGDEEGRLKDNPCYFSFATEINLMNDIVRPHDANRLSFMNTNNVEHDIEVRHHTFCGVSFFTGNTENEFRPQSVQLNLGNFAKCVEFYHEGYQPDEEVSFVLMKEEN